MARPHVVVIGAGFGGLAAAKELDDAPVDVTLVDRNNFHTFLPLLYQVATSGLASADVAYPVRGIVARQENLEFRQATVIGADLEARRLHLHGDAHEVGDLSYDHLVVAAGATTNTFGIPGVDQHGFPLYDLDDAVALRNHVLERFEATEARPELVDEGSLSFVVVGGGPTGVEVAGALVELIDKVLRRDFKHLPVDRARVVLVEMLDHLLAPFSEPSQRHARQGLEERGVEVRTGAQVARVRATSVELVDGQVLPAHTLVWAAGVRANPVAEALGLPVGRGGRIPVGADLAVPGHPGVWAIGDVAAIADARSVDGRPLPQLAPVAMQSGRHVAHQIAAVVAGDVTKPFRYRDKGTMATIGRSRAVAELPLGIRLRGVAAWLSWLGLHLVFLAGFRNRISVFVNWAWNYLTWDRGPRLIFRPRR
ncbi:MAG TPA: NAD(P)/FAD-dependent oxidoreductase [Aquihabitans sp.]|jgi:NADH dehydrogenase|nr:NAD(P)/FAD-dependent oxidoreductase [Aquihabitans sp.]